MPLHPPGDETTLRRAMEGDRAAMDRLAAQSTRSLRDWASGRLPHHARDLGDTVDLVQICLTRTMARLGSLHFDDEAGFHAYLRRAVRNEITNQLKRARRRPSAEPITCEEPDPSPSPLEDVISSEVSARYRSALGKLRAQEREIVRLRLEAGLDYAAIAGMAGFPSYDSARMAVNRALRGLRAEMDAMRDDVR